MTGLLFGFCSGEATHVSAAYRSVWRRLGNESRRCKRLDEPAAAPGPGKALVQVASWTQGTIELRNAVRGPLLDVSYSSDHRCCSLTRGTGASSHSSQSACVSEAAASNYGD